MAACNHSFDIFLFVQIHFICLRFPWQNDISNNASDKNLLRWCLLTMLLLFIVKIFVFNTVMEVVILCIMVWKKRRRISNRLMHLYIRENECVIRQPCDPLSLKSSQDLHCCLVAKSYVKSIWRLILCPCLFKCE